MPTSLISSTYLPLPVIKRRSSLRTTLAPMPSTPISLLPTGVSDPPIPSNAAVSWFSRDCTQRLFGRLRDLHAPGGIQHRLDDVVIAGAAADIAFELLPDGGLVELATMALDDIDRRHDHARGAVAALQAVIVAERRLHRMQLVALRDALDGGDAGTRSLSRQHGAGLHGPAVDMDDAGAALAGVTADMGASKVEVFAQEMDQKRPVLDIDGDRLAVHCQFDCRHIIPPGEFIISPIRDRGLELCNWEIGREKHCDGAGLLTLSEGPVQKGGMRYPVNLRPLIHSALGCSLKP